MIGRRAFSAAPAALVAIAALGLATSRPGPAPAGEPVVVLTARYSRFMPAEVVVPAGTRVRFIMRNLDPIDHEMILSDAAVHARHERGTEARHGAVSGEVSVSAGESASTIFTFTEPGVVEFACHLPGHRAYGMRGAVRVV